MKNKVIFSTVFCIGVLIQSLLGKVAAQDSTEPQTMPITFAQPKPEKQTGLKRPKGDGNLWTFIIQPEANIQWVQGPTWSYPGKGGGSEIDWGQWGGGDGQTWLSWISPQVAAPFTIKVTGKIVHAGGPGGGDGPGEIPIDIEASWEGEVEFNASMTVQRIGPAPLVPAASTAVVLAGALPSEPHQATIKVTATNDQGALLSGVKITAPTITGGTGISADGNTNSASITPASATTGNDGTASFTYTSSNKITTVTIKLESGQKNGPQNATIDQRWDDIVANDPTIPTRPLLWSYDPYFWYGERSTITFTPKFLEGSAFYAVSGHKVNFINSSAHVLVWNGANYDPATYSPDGTGTIYSHRTSGLALAKFISGQKVADSGSGTYSSDQVVEFSPYEWIDTVTFTAEDDGTYK